MGYPVNRAVGRGSNQYVQRGTAVADTPTRRDLAEIAVAFDGRWDGVDNPVDWTEANFDPDAAWDWQSEGFTPETASAWRQAGFDAETAQQWVDAGFTDATQAADYHGEEHFESPADARSWNRLEVFANDAALAVTWDEHFSSETAAGWCDLGFEVEDAYTLDVAGVEPGEAVTWRDAEFDADTTVDWMAHDFDPDTACEWREAGFEAEEAFEHVREGFDTPADLNAPPDEVDESE